MMETINSKNNVELVKIIFVLWKYKMFIFLLSISCIFLTAVYLYFTPDIYRVSATIMPLQGQRSFNIPFFEKVFEVKDFEHLLRANLTAYFHDPNIMFIKSIIDSRDFNIRVIEKNNLLPELYNHIWDKNTNKWKCLNTESKLQTIIHRIIGKNTLECPPSVVAGAASLNKQIKIDKPQYDSIYLVLYLDHLDQQFAFKILSIYIKELDRYIREIEYRRADANIVYLNSIIPLEKNKEIREGLIRVRNSQILIKKYSEGIKDFGFQIIDPPIIRHKPFKPRRQSILICSFIASIVLGCMGALFVDTHLKKTT